MDVEHLISEDGIPDGYRFDQLSTQCTVSFPVPPGASLGDIEFRFDAAAREIFVRAAGSDRPQLCGVLGGTVRSEHHEIVDGVFHIVLEKADEVIWAYLISGRSRDGIDAKSLFVLAFGADARGSPREAFGLFRETARMGFVQAKLVVADTYLRDDNPYDVRADCAKAIAVLESIPEERFGAELCMYLARAYVMAREQKKAVDVLRRVAGESDEARLQLAKLLSPVCAEGAAEEGAAEEAAEHLRILAKRGCAEAMRVLAQHYANGCGVKRDPSKAKSLLRRAKEADPSVMEGCERAYVSRTVVAAVAVAVAAIGIIGIGVFARRRK